MMLQVYILQSFGECMKVYVEHCYEEPFYTFLVFRVIHPLQSEEQWKTAE